MDGFALQNLREEQGLSREELAERILVTESIIQSWEEGWSFISPSSWEIEAMADAFNMTVDDFRTAIDHDECEDSDNQDYRHSPAVVLLP